MCELDIIFNFEKAYFILDEFLMGGEIQDTSKKSVLKAIEQADLLQEVCIFWCAFFTENVNMLWIQFGHIPNLESSVYFAIQLLPGLAINWNEN